MKEYFSIDSNNKVFIQAFEIGKQPNGFLEFHPNEITSSAICLMYNIENNEFYEGATQEEMIEVTPEKVTDIQFISQLALEGISEDSVISIIETLPEPYRTIAMVSFKRETEFHRNNPLVELVRIGLKMTNERLDQIFINASKITNK